MEARQPDAYLYEHDGMVHDADHPPILRMPWERMGPCAEPWNETPLYRQEHVIDTVDLFGTKANGETVLIGQVAMPPSMKAKEIIRELIGGNFDDEDSDASMWLYAFEQFAEWMKKQKAGAA